MPSKKKYDLPDVDIRIGETLAKIRKENGLTQKELAELTGISQQQQSHYEKGILHISAEMLARFSIALKVTSDKILNLENEEKNNNSLSLRFTRRIKELDSLPEAKKKAVLQVLDDLIRANA